MASRLASMRRGELSDRLRQKLSQYHDWFRLRTGQDFPGHEITGADVSGSFFFHPQEVRDRVDLLRERVPEQVTDILRRADHIVQHRFDLLGYRDLAYGSPVDWHFDKVHRKHAPRRMFYRIKYLDFEEVGDAKITWELNRHQHLVTLAKAYHLTEDSRFADELVRQWYHWQAVNPYPVGINWSSSLEVAFRALSWLWVRALLSETPHWTKEFSRDLLRALAVSGRHIERHLSTYFSPNTHLLGEGVALFFIGTLCPTLRSANRWRDKGWKIVLNAAKHQVYADGLHFEQSVYYHVYALDFFLHSILLAAQNGMAIPPEFEATIARMTDALATICRAGLAPRFGDDDGGRLFDPLRNQAEHLLDPLATGALLFGRSDLKALSGGLCEETLWLLGRAGARRYDEIRNEPPVMDSKALTNGGIYIMASGESAPQQLMLDAGPQGGLSAGHGHADALSVQLIVGGRALLTDPGTFEYVGDSPERDRFRGTAAHNTLVVDGRDQSDPAGPFAWGRLTRTAVERWITGQTFDFFAGKHDGYGRLESPVIHRRSVFHKKNEFWMVRDVAAGGGKHCLEISWHLGPELEAGVFPGTFTGKEGPGIAVVGVQDAHWSCDNEDAEWSAAYGSKQMAPCCRFRREAELPAEFLTVLVPQIGAATSPGSVKHVGDPLANRDVSGYHYQTAADLHGIFFRLSYRPWILGAWASDAEVLYFHKDGEGLKEVIFCQGSYVEYGRKRFVAATGPVSSCELLRSQRSTHVVSPDKENILVHVSLHEISVGREPVASGAFPKVGH
jgi:hypothetical protein